MAAEQRSIWGYRFDLLGLKCSGQGPLTSSATGALLPTLPQAQWSTLGSVTCVGLLNPAVPGALISLSHTSLSSDDSTHSLSFRSRKLTHTQDLSWNSKMNYCFYGTVRLIYWIDYWLFYWRTHTNADPKCCVFVSVFFYPSLPLPF